MVVGCVEMDMGGCNVGEGWGADVVLEKLLVWVLEEEEELVWVMEKLVEGVVAGFLRKTESSG